MPNYSPSLHVHNQPTDSLTPQSRQEWTQEKVQALREQLVQERQRLYREELADWISGTSHHRHH